jgi:hypothetical protein
MMQAQSLSRAAVEPLVGVDTSRRRDIESRGGAVVRLRVLKASVPMLDSAPPREDEGELHPLLVELIDSLARSAVRRENRRVGTIH